MKKIKTLTEEKKSKFAYYVKKWTDIGLSTEPANMEETKKYIHIAYENAGLKPPEKIVLCGSPLSLGLVKATLLYGNKNLLISYSDGCNITSNCYKLIENHEIFEN